MSAYFRGGYAPVAYAASMLEGDGENSQNGAFKGSIEKGTSMLKIAFRDTATIAGTTPVPASARSVDTSQASNSIVTVTATDAEGNIATKVVHILSNRAPLTPNPGTVWTTNVGTEVREKKKVVTCPTNFQTAVAAANTPHQCTVEASADQFTDDGDYVLSVVGSNSKVAITADKKKLTITGLMSTWDKDKQGGAGHVPAEVTIRATDENGLSAERKLQINVDSAPTVETQIPNRTFKEGKADGVAARNIVGFFKDDSSTLAVSDVTVTSSKVHVATVSIAGTDNDDVIINALNPGSTEITVTMTEPDQTLGQAVSQKFTVTVTKDA